MRTIMYVVFLGLVSTYLLPAQDVMLTNPSFEDTPRMGRLEMGFRSAPVEGWFDCGALEFRFETPPDVHPSADSYWGNSIAASNGSTYVGMVVRENETWESISQQLEQPLIAGNCYSFSIEICRSPKYKSGTKLSPDTLRNFTTPCVLKISGGQEMCQEMEILAESKPVSSDDWKTFAFKIEPSQNYNYIKFEAFYKVPVLEAYNGHILIDNASSFKIIPCDKDEKEILAEAEEKNKSDDKMNVIAAIDEKKMEERKTKVIGRDTKEETTEVFVKEKVEKKRDTVVYVKPKPKATEMVILKDFKRENLHVGKSILVKELQFEADTSTLDKKSIPALDEIAYFLDSNEDVIIEIGGHTNGAPEHWYCDSLSTLRAQIVADQLIEKGIPQEQLFVKGYGKRKPIASNKTPQGRQRNQRVEIKILKMN